MKAKVGSDASTPAPPCTSMKKKIESPSVPKNDAITVAMSTSGATIACSRIPRMIVMTSRVTGTITRMSRAAASLKSCWIALPAPTSATAPPGRSPRLSRSVSTRASAASEYGSSSKFTSTFAIAPSSDRCGSPTDATPSIPSRRSRTAAMSASVASPPSRCTRIEVGASAPCGNDSLSTSKPSTLSTSFLKNPPIE